MALSELYVEHDDGRRGVIVGYGDHCYHRVVVCDTGEEEQWHIQELTWLYLVSEKPSHSALRI